METKNIALIALALGGLYLLTKSSDTYTANKRKARRKPARGKKRKVARRRGRGRPRMAMSRVNLESALLQQHGVPSAEANKLARWGQKAANRRRFASIIRKLPSKRWKITWPMMFKTAKARRIRSIERF